MEKEEIVQFLEEKLAKLKADSPGAFNSIGAYEYVINDVLND